MIRLPSIPCPVRMDVSPMAHSNKGQRSLEYHIAQRTPLEQVARDFTQHTKSEAELYAEQWRVAA